MNPEASSSALSVISAIVTPALLILACSNLITATSNRLSRLLDRVRELMQDAEALPGDTAECTEKTELLLLLLRKTAVRTLLIQRALAALYACLGCLILTSVVIGVGAAIGRQEPALIMLAIFVSVAFLFYASALLIRESRIALAAVNAEMDYVRKLIG